RQCAHGEAITVEVILDGPKFREWCSHGFVYRDLPLRSRVLSSSIGFCVRCIESSGPAAANHLGRRPANNVAESQLALLGGVPADDFAVIEEDRRDIDSVAVAPNF